MSLMSRITASVYRLAHMMGRGRRIRRVAGGYWAWMRECHHENRLAEIKASYDIDPTVRWGYGTCIYGAGAIFIGERTYLGTGCFVSSDPHEATIRIGRCCAIAHGVHLRTTSYQRNPDFSTAFDAPSEYGDIVVGDYVWIGNHVYIGGGITIGSNVIIGANSVITHDVEPNTVVGGVPARIIRRKDTYTGQ